MAAFLLPFERFAQFKASCPERNKRQQKCKMKNGECKIKDRVDSTGTIGFDGDERPPESVIQLLAFVDQFGQARQRQQLGLDD
jgi:hypothetical protein